MYIYIYTKEKRRMNEVKMSEEYMHEKKENEKKMKNKHKLFINKINIYE